MANQIQRSAPAALAAQSVEDLNRRGAAFIRDFDEHELRMEEIARAFDGIAAEVNGMVDGADTVTTTVGKVTAAVGLGITALGLMAAPFTGGTSSVVSVGALTTAVGGTMAITAKVGQFLRESRNAKDLERLGTEFMMIAQPLDEELKEIKAMAKQVKVEVAKCYLMEKAQGVDNALQLVDDTSGAITEAKAFIKSLVQVTLKLLQHISTHKEEDELTEKVVKSSEDFWKIIYRFREVKEDLQGFKTNINAIC